jgi:hypothetical protein
MQSKVSVLSNINTSKRNRIIALSAALLIALGGYWMISSRAASFFVSVNPEGSTLSGNAKLVAEADGTKVLQFNAPTPPPTTPPPTTPPPTTPPPGNGTQSCPAYPAFPNADCTGVPAGVSLTVVNGDVTLSTAGMIYDAKDVRGAIIVTANNVTIKRSKVRDGIKITNNKGLVVEDTELGPVTGKGGLDDGIAFSDYTCRRCDIHNFSDGGKINGNVTIEDSWIHDFPYKPGDHNDALQNNAGSGNVTIRHSNIDIRSFEGSTLKDAGNAAIFMAKDNGTISGHMIIENNLLAGGGYTLQLRDLAGYSAVVRGNHFVRGSYTWGTHILDSPSSNAVWENNVYSDNKQPIGK